MWSLGIAVTLLLACAPDADRKDRRHEEPVGRAQSPSIAHDLSWKINTTNSGAAYIQECTAAGVPVPEIIADSTDSRWINHGRLQTEFISSTYEAELWSYEDPNVDGVCAALPRWKTDDTAQLYGVICLGRASGKICFWDNPSEVFFPRYQGIPIGDFMGGSALDGNGGGPCSDCHAGENPFIVHPKDDAFEDFRGARDLEPQGWPRPILPSAFPGNPGPIEKMGPVPAGEVRCDTCHNAAGPNRLPLVSNALPGYCNRVLANAVGGPNQTMPDGGGNGATHTNWLQSLCNSEPIVGTIVPIDDFAPEVLSPPSLGPVFACTTKVMVSGLVYGATVTVKVDSTVVPVPGTATGPEMELDVGTPLVVGQTLTASQSFGGFVSAVTNEVVQDHEKLYEQGLPAPTIAPAPLYTCARSIATLNIPGVELIVEKRNGGMLGIPTSSRRGSRIRGLACIMSLHSSAATLLR